MTSDRRGVSGYTQLQKSTPPGTGYGYRMRAYSGFTQGLDGGVSYQNAVGTYALEGEQVDGITRTRASASGGVALMGAGLFPSRRIENSFAIARVGDQADVRVYRDNQLVGRTNDDGFVILPGLRAYEDNQIRIEQADLPLDVRVDTLFIGRQCPGIAAACCCPSRSSGRGARSSPCCWKTASRCRPVPK